MEYTRNIPNGWNIPVIQKYNLVMHCITLVLPEKYVKVTYIFPAHSTIYTLIQRADNRASEVTETLSLKLTEDRPCMHACMHTWMDG